MPDPPLELLPIGPVGGDEGAGIDPIAAVDARTLVRRFCELEADVASGAAAMHATTGILEAMRGDLGAIREVIDQLRTEVAASTEATRETRPELARALEVLAELPDLVRANTGALEAVARGLERQG